MSRSKEDSFKTFMQSELHHVLNRVMGEYSRLQQDQVSPWGSQEAMPKLTSLTNLPDDLSEDSEEGVHIEDLHVQKPSKDKVLPVRKPSKEIVVGQKQSKSHSNNVRRPEPRNSDPGIVPVKPPLPGPRRVSWGPSDLEDDVPLPSSATTPPLLQEDARDTEPSMKSWEVQHADDSCLDILGFDTTDVQVFKEVIPPTVHSHSPRESRAKTGAQNNEDGEELEAMMLMEESEGDENEMCAMPDCLEMMRSSESNEKGEQPTWESEKSADCTGSFAGSSRQGSKQSRTSKAEEEEEQEEPEAESPRVQKSASMNSMASIRSNVSENDNGRHKILDTWVKVGRSRSRKMSAFNRGTTVMNMDDMERLDMSDLDSQASSVDGYSLAGDSEALSFRVSRALGGLTQRMMLLPNSRWRVIWEMICLVCICWDVIMIPFHWVSPESESVFVVVSWLVRLFWTLDIPFNVLVGFTAADGVLVSSMAAAAKRYLRTSFAFDAALVSCRWIDFAMDETLTEDDHALMDVLGVLRALQLLRLYRLARVHRTCDQLFMQSRSEETVLVWYMSIASVVLLLIVHVLGCIWHVVSNNEFSTPSDGLADSYMKSVHTMLALLIGEHVVLPEKLSQRLFFVFILLFGFVLSAASIGALTTALSRLQELARQRSKLFATLNRFLSENAISSNLNARINRNAHSTYDEKRMHVQENQVDLLHLVSEQLRIELRYEMHVTLLCTHPFLQLFDRLHTRAIQHLCSNAITIVRITRGDVIFSTMEVPNKPAMYIVKSGSFRYLGMEGKQEICDGMIVAEGALWTSWAHCGTMKAARESQLMHVDAQAFGKAMRKVPLPHTKAYAVRFLDYLNSLENLSDIGPERYEMRRIAVEVFSAEDHEFSAPPEWGTNRRGSGGLLNPFAGTGMNSMSMDSFKNLMPRRSSFSGGLPGMEGLNRLSMSSSMTDQ